MSARGHTADYLLLGFGFLGADNDSEVINTGGNRKYRRTDAWGDYFGCSIGKKPVVEIDIDARNYE